MARSTLGLTGSPFLQVYLWDTGSREPLAPVVEDLVASGLVELLLLQVGALFCCLLLAE